MLLNELKNDTRTKELLIIKRKSKPKPSIAYNTYWKFAVERQNIFLTASMAKVILGLKMKYLIDSNSQMFTELPTE